MNEIYQALAFCDNYKVGYPSDQVVQQLKEEGYLQTVFEDDQPTTITTFKGQLALSQMTMEENRDETVNGWTATQRAEARIDEDWCEICEQVISSTKHNPQCPGWV